MIPSFSDEYKCAELPVGGSASYFPGTWACDTPYSTWAVLDSVPGNFWLHQYEGGLARKTNQINSLQEDRRALVRIPRL